MSPRKMRLVVNNIRGKKVSDALNILKFTKNESAIWLQKLLLSAVANWENKLENTVSSDDYGLVVKTIFVDEASMLKRFRPATHGRAARIHKRRNHVTLIVSNSVPLEKMASTNAAEGEDVGSED